MGVEVNWGNWLGRTVVLFSGVGINTDPTRGLVVGSEVLVCMGEIRAKPGGG